MNAFSEMSGSFYLKGNDYLSSGIKLPAQDLSLSKDEDLMDLVVEGNQEAFAILMERHLSRITALAARIVYSGGDAEDAAQEVFINVWKRKDTWLNWRSAFSTWLYRITVHKCVDLNKKSRFNSLDDAPEPTCNALDAVSTLFIDQFSKHLREAISELSEGQKMAVSLHYQEGLTADECASVLGMKRSAVEGLLKRARQKIRELLDQSDLLSDRVDAPNQIVLSA